LLLSVACTLPPTSEDGGNAAQLAASAVVVRGALRLEPGEVVDAPPELTSVRPPRYPEGALDDGISGTVWVRVRVLEEGRISEVVHVESGPAELHQSAIDAIRTALFLPAMLSGRPVAVWASIPIEYSLKQ
jgi:TonB family protein